MLWVSYCQGVSQYFSLVIQFTLCENYKVENMFQQAVQAFVFMIVVSSQSAASLRDDYSSCPIWTLPQSVNGTTVCICGSSLNRIVSCEPSTLNVFIRNYHCMTYSNALNDTVVGGCLYNFHENGQRFNTYWPVPRLEHRNDTAVCHFTDYCERHNVCTYYQHQTGLMCTNCVDGYAYPVYSYSLACVKCKDYKYNWLKYIAIAFLPLTIFFCIVVLLRISVTCGAMNAYVLMCQLIATPESIRQFQRIGKRIIGGTYFSVFGIWNLDFFRGLYSPFCLHPKLTTLQTLMLDYVISVYPLLLVIVTYIFVKLHNHYSIVVWLWSPFYKCFAFLRNKWDISGSLVGAFATFILLSYVKILNVSFYVLTPNSFYNVRGKLMSNRFVFYDGSYEYFGPDHIPYAMVAIFMLLVFNVCPLMLLCLYPCRCFQRCLNYSRLQCLALHIFMDTFTGCYKLHPWDCRYFAAVYLLLRIINLHVFTIISTTSGLLHVCWCYVRYNGSCGYDNQTT